MLEADAAFTHVLKKKKIQIVDAVTCFVAHPIFEAKLPVLYLFLKLA